MSHSFSRSTARALVTVTIASFGLLLSSLSADISFTNAQVSNSPVNEIGKSDSAAESSPDEEGMAAIPRPDLKMAVWPGTPPGDQTLKLAAEADTSGPNSNRVAGKYVIRLGNVSTPEIAIYRPDPQLDTGKSVVICPGGGYYILAYDLEGTEVAQWLNSQGITAVVLKYRVPARENQPRHLAAVQDTQRAVSLVREKARDWKLNPDQIGVLGFSAGGHAAGMATLLRDDRQYEAIDETDKFSCAPDFSILVYPAYLVDLKTGELTDSLEIAPGMGPVFLVHAQDDPVTPLTSLMLATKLKEANVPVELHLYNEGGHGYGMRKTDLSVTRWTELCEPWLKKIGK